ncbi:hypothetical protein [Streptomyces sp. UG1]
MRTDSTSSTVCETTVTSHSGVRPSFTAVRVVLFTEPLAIGEIWIS